MNILVDVDDKPSFGIASRDVSEVLSNCKTKFKCHVLIVIPCILDLCLAPTFVFLFIEKQNLGLSISLNASFLQHCSFILVSNYG